MLSAVASDGASTQEKASSAGNGRVRVGLGSSATRASRSQKRGFAPHGRFFTKSWADEDAKAANMSGTAFSVTIVPTI